jgi:hypothetical protein
MLGQEFQFLSRSIDVIRLAHPMRTSLMTSRKKPGLAFWATVALVVVLVAYPLSFGPACWVATWLDRDSEYAFVRDAHIIGTVYRPPINIILFCFKDRYPPRKVIYEYGAWGTGSSHSIAGLSMLLATE